MAQQRSYIGDGLFWGLMAFLLAGTFGLGIAFAVAEIHGSGWLTGVAVGGVAAVIGGIILALSATGKSLPPPNTLKAPVVPMGDSARAARAPAPAAAAPAAKPAPASAPDAAAPSAVETAAEKAGYTASAAVTSAARAAREAMAGVADLAGAAKDKVEAAVAPAVEAIKPKSLGAPRDGGADDLKKIKGVGPKLEEMLHGLGYYHFDQVAKWTPGEIAWVDSNLEGFNGRATRDDWVGQAKFLAAGGETEFSERVDKGDV